MPPCRLPEPPLPPRGVRKANASAREYLWVPCSQTWTPLRMRAFGWQNHGPGRLCALVPLDGTNHMFECLCACTPQEYNKEASLEAYRALVEAGLTFIDTVSRRGQGANGREGPSLGVG